jgi:hypothetical protein
LTDQSRILLAASNNAADPIGGGVLSVKCGSSAARWRARMRVERLCSTGAGFANFEGRSTDSILYFCSADHVFVPDLHV